MTKKSINGNEHIDGNAIIEKKESKQTVKQLVANYQNEFAKALKAKYPEVYKAVVKSTSSRTFKARAM